MGYHVHAMYIFIYLDTSMIQDTPVSWAIKSFFSLPVRLSLITTWIHRYIEK
jgi:hypothetical protein